MADERSALQDGLDEGIFWSMSRFKPYDRNGFDEATELPKAMEKATEDDFASSEDGDELDEEERRHLHEALISSEEDVQQGRVQAADDVLADLRHTLR